MTATLADLESQLKDAKDMLHRIEGRVSELKAETDPLKMGKSVGIRIGELVQNMAKDRIGNDIGFATVSVSNVNASLGHKRVNISFEYSDEVVYDMLRRVISPSA